MCIYIYIQREREIRISCIIIRGTKEVLRKGVRALVDIRVRKMQRIYGKTLSNQLLLTTPIPWDPLSSL